MAPKASAVVNFSELTHCFLSTEDWCAWFRLHIGPPAPLWGSDGSFSGKCAWARLPRPEQNVVSAQDLSCQRTIETSYSKRYWEQGQLEGFYVSNSSSGILTTGLDLNRALVAEWSCLSLTIPHLRFPLLQDHLSETREPSFWETSFSCVWPHALSLLLLDWNS